MLPADWSLIERLFHDASAAAPSARPAVLSEAPPHVRTEVEALLAAAERADAVFDHPLADALPTLFTTADLPPGVARGAFGPGDRVGAYRLETLAGEGGMGQVWRARRDDGVHDTPVALKLVRTAGGATAALRARFARERTLLAALAHPGIARLLDGGEASDGTPFLVMELVAGEPITAYADARRLGLRARASLVVAVADAVAYAHRRLVVHRDLKPSNVLVAEGDADAPPVVKLLDFGVARLLGTPDATSDDEPVHPSGDDVTELGGAGLQPFTRGWAAPEQTRGETVTTATDVYALGLLLRRLVDGASGERALAEDLAAVAERATRDEPEARYASADAFAADLRRALAGEPVRARTGRLYRARRFVRRHRLGVATGAAVVLLLAVFAATTAAQERRTARERDRAEATATFLAGLFEGAAPEATQGRDVSARALLDAGAARLDSLPRDPRTRARLLTTVGRVYGQIGAREAAERHLRRALALYAALPDADPLGVATARHELGHTLAMLGRPDEARPLLNAALVARRRHLGPSAPETAATAQELGAVATTDGDYEAAERWLRAAVAVYRRGTDGEALARALAELGATHLSQRQLPEADSALTEAFARRRRLLPPLHPDRLHSLHMLGTLRYQQGRLDEARRLLGASVAQSARVQSEDGARLAARVNDLGLVLQAMGESEAAMRAFRRALALQQRHTPDHAEMIATTLHNLGWASRKAGQLDEAERRFGESLALNRRELGAEHLNTSFQLLELARVSLARGRPAEALERATAARDIRTRELEPGNPLVVEARGVTARALREAGRFDEAARELEATRTAALALGEAGAAFVVDADSQRVTLERRRAARR